MTVAWEEIEADERYRTAPAEKQQSIRAQWEQDNSPSSESVMAPEPAAAFPKWEEIEADERYKAAPPEKQQSIRSRWEADTGYQPKERGLLGDIGSHIYRGALDVAEHTGRAMQMADMKPEETPEEEGKMDRYGRKLTEWAEHKLATAPRAQPDRSEAAGDESWFKQKAMEGVRSTVLSMAPIATAGAGFIAGGAMTGGSPVGAGAGAIAGGAAGVASLFGLATYHKQREELNNTDLPDEEKHAAARDYALIEAGGEAVADLVDWMMLKTGKVIGASQGAKNVTKATIRSLLKTPPKEIAKRGAMVYANEWGTETVQGKLQSDIDAKTGLGEQMGYIESAIETAIPVAVMTLTFGAFSGGLTANERRKVKKDLNSDKVEDRIRGANRILSEIDDPEIAKSWKDMSIDIIRNGGTFDLDENISEYVRQAQEAPKPPGPVSRAAEIARPTGAAEREQAGEKLDAQRMEILSRARNKKAAGIKLTAQEQAALEAEAWDKTAPPAKEMPRGAIPPGTTPSGTLSRIVAEARYKRYQPEVPGGLIDAESIRGDEGQIQGPWIERPGGEAEGGQDFQLQQEAGAETGIEGGQDVRTERESGPGIERDEREGGREGQETGEETTGGVRRPPGVDREETGRDAEKIRRAAGLEEPLSTETVERPDSIAVGQDVNVTPTEPMKEAENYKKAHVKLDGFDISVENPVGSVRSGKDKTGKEWSQEVKADYGYFKGSVGFDKDHVDTFIKPGYKGGAQTAYIINQVNPDGSFDEHKVVLGAESEQEAMEIYNSNYEEGWTGGKNVVAMPMERFKEWVKSEEPKKGEVSAPEATAKAEAAEEKGPERTEPHIGPDELINGISREVAGDMLAAGDEEVLEHIRQGVEKHGPELMQHAIRDDVSGEKAAEPQQPETVKEPELFIQENVPITTKYGTFDYLLITGNTKEHVARIKAADRAAKWLRDRKAWRFPMKSAESVKKNLADLLGVATATEGIAAAKGEHVAETADTAKEAEKESVQVGIAATEEINGVTYEYRIARIPKEERKDSPQLTHRVEVRRVGGEIWESAGMGKALTAIKAADRLVDNIVRSNRPASAFDLKNQYIKNKVESELEKKKAAEEETAISEKEESDKIKAEFEARGKYLEAVNSFPVKGKKATLTIHTNDGPQQVDGINYGDWYMHKAWGFNANKETAVSDAISGMMAFKGTKKDALSVVKALKKEGISLPFDARNRDSLAKNERKQLDEAASKAMEVVGFFNGGPVPSFVKPPQATVPGTQQATEPAMAAMGIETEDAGAELAYNKRNRIKSGLKWGDIKDKDAALRVRETTKAKVYPKPDYDGLITDGMEPVVAHVIKQAYDAIAVKPRTRTAPTDENLQQYINAVNSYMDGVFKWAGDSNAVASWIRTVSQSARQRLGMMSGQVTSISSLAEEPGKTLLDIVYPDGWKNSRADISIIGGNRALRALQPHTDEVVKAMQEIDKGWPKPQEAWQRQGYQIISGNDIEVGYYEGTDHTGAPYVSVWFKKGRRDFEQKSIDAKSKNDPAVTSFVENRLNELKGKSILVDKRFNLVGEFKNEERAREAARKAVEKSKKSPKIKDEGISVEAAKRIGKERREQGENITSQKLMETFGFKGVNFGNWMKGKANEAERQLHLNHAYDSFLDLAEVLNIPPKAISLNGLLGIAIGAQGSGGFAAAHFVPGVNEINLTRTKGAGSLAHEWAHGLDHYFARLAGNVRGSEPFITEMTRAASENIRPEIVERFKKIVATMRKRPITEKERLEQIEAREKRTRRNIDGWLAGIKSNTIYGAEDKEIGKKFDAIAKKISSLDLGGGKVQISRPARRNALPTAFYPAIIELRELYKKAQGRMPGLDDYKALQANIDSLQYAIESRNHDERHVPQVATTYLTDASKLDKEKGGKKYWSTSLEMFARAFDAYVSDRLEEGAISNTYLSHAGRTGDTVPGGDERLAINKAIDDLVSILKTKETDKGVALYSQVTPTSASTVSQVRTALTTGLRGKKVRRLIEEGKLRIVQSVRELPDEVTLSPNGAYYVDQDRIYLVADNITPGTETETLLHEGFHREVERMNAGKNPALQKIMDSLADLEKRKSTEEWFTKARKAAQVAKDSPHYIEEIGAYAVTQYTAGEKQPFSIRRWVKKLLAYAKVALLERYGIMGKLDDAMLARIAERGLRVAPVKEEGLAAEGEPAFSQIAKEMGISIEEAKRQYEAVEKQYRGTDQWMKAPNGQPTKLNERQWIQVRTPAFKEWFGDWENDPENASKVVDENGEPLVVYHGSASDDIQVFDPQRVGSVQKTDWGEGVYFTPSQYSGEYYAEEAMSRTEDVEGDRLYQEYEAKAKEFGTDTMSASIDLGYNSEKYRELDVYAQRWLKHKEKFRKENKGTVYAAFLNIRKPFRNTYVGITEPDLHEIAAREGKDGIFIAPERDEGETFDSLIQEIVVFSPNQIKSAIGNTGQFSPYDDRISYSQAEIMKHAKAFYSKLQQVAADKFQGMKAQSVLPFLLKNGVKKEEIEATGVKEWLAAMKPTDKVSQQELGDFVQANAVELEDVVLGEGLEPLNKNEERIYRQLEAMRRANAFTMPGQEEQLQELAARRSAYKDVVHFPQYQEPGAEEGSYREMFVTAPQVFVPRSEQINLTDNISFEWFGVPLSKLTAEQKERIQRESKEWEDGHPQYSDIQNPIVRIRFNSRTDSQGRRILFVEEMQGPSKDNQAKMPAYLRDNLYNLGVKRILAYAKENGFDGVSWTTGEMQGDRYSLSKQVDTVHWEPGFYTDAGRLTATKDGKEVISEGTQEEKLADFIGKDAAQKLLSSEPEQTRMGEVYTLSGQDLDVGNRGLRQLYNTTLPKMFEAYAKGKVGEAKIQTTEAGENEGYKVILPEGTLNFSTREEAERIAAQEGGEVRPIWERRAVPFIPLTNAPESFPIFSQGKPIQRVTKAMLETTAFKEWFGKSVVRTTSGEPVPVWHGTNDKGFLQGGEWAFDRKKGKGKHHSPLAGLGNFFALNRTEAVGYTKGKGVVRPFYVSLQNPLIIESWKLNHLNTRAEAEAFAKRMSLRGHDGIIFPDQDHVVVFQPGNIKSAEYQTGEWDRIFDDTRFSVGPAVTEAFDVPEQHSLATTLKNSLKPGTMTREDVSGYLDATRTELIDRLHPIKTLGPTAYKLHSLLHNAHAVFATFLHHGKLQWLDQALAITEKDKGFLPWFHSLGKDGRNFFYWLATKRAEVLEGEERENWLTEDRREAIRDEIFSGLTREQRAAKEKKFEQLNNEFQKFNANVLDIAIEAGLITEEQRNSWTRDFYLPFYRIMEAQATREEMLQGPRKYKKHVSAQIRRLKGGEEKLGDPLENVLRNWFHLIQESQRNVARAEAATVAVDQGLAEEISKKELLKIVGSKTIKRWGIRKKGNERVTRYFDSREAAEANLPEDYEIVEKRDTQVIFGRKEDFAIMSYQRDGQTVYLRVNDPALYDALTEVNAKAFESKTLKLMMFSKRLLTMGATFTPAFRIANMIRDTVHSFVVSRSFMPFVDTAKGFVKVWKESPEFVALMASGGGFGQGWVESGDPKAMAREISKIIKRETTAKGTLIDTPRKALDLWQKIGMASEMAARVQLYSNLRGKGVSHMEAAFEARDLLDFFKSGAGNSVRVLMAVSPFLNARVQGLDRLYRGAKQDKAAFMTKGAMVAAASIMLWLLFKDDDRYKDLEDWEKWQYHHFWIGDMHYRIPKAFETGALFSTLFESLGNVMAGNEDWEFFGRFVQHTLRETFAADIPVFFGPTIEAYANKSAFTGRPIESLSQQRMRPGERANPWTPELLKDLGKITNISPVKAEHIIQGHTAAFGAIFLTIADAAYRIGVDAPTRPAKRLQDIPGIGRFVRDDDSRTKYATRYYEFAREVNELVAAVNNYKNLGEREMAKKIISENIDTYKHRKMINRVQGRLSLLRKREKYIWNRRDMTPEQKREELKKLADRKNELVRRAYEAVNQ